MEYNLTVCFTELSIDFIFHVFFPLFLFSRPFAPPQSPPRTPDFALSGLIPHEIRLSGVLSEAVSSRPVGAGRPKCRPFRPSLGSSCLFRLGLVHLAIVSDYRGTSPPLVPGFGIELHSGPKPGQQPPLLSIDEHPSPSMSHLVLGGSQVCH